MGVHVKATLRPRQCKHNHVYVEYASARIFVNMKYIQ